MHAQEELECSRKCNTDIRLRSDDINAIYDISRAHHALRQRLKIQHAGNENSKTPACIASTSFSRFDICYEEGNTEVEVQEIVSSHKTSYCNVLNN